MTIRPRLKAILEENGTKQRWLCEKTGLDKNAVSRLVLGWSLPTLPNAYKIARALGKSVEEIWVWEDDGE
ncbi:helix-turn-helix transcriptional regulator [Alicyclobacillus sp. ALC3]|uniref:helix-turn-helix transcriptional regulator n=1 Tax=Alicyclobacillus sp. ALC3 TaxID=2796143 RepID=UPI002377FF85|nr:helix-turn-helix transcriptional regulator [Alicyclobacillus sp. ALC3]